MAKLDYKFRPAKDVERQMIGEACRRLSVIAPTDRYHYIGFGALEFVDFQLFHRALGITRMTSIEQDQIWPKRYEFNKPFRGVEVLIGRASQHLPMLDWSGLKIVWLDYEGQLCGEFIRDCETVIRVLEQGSVLIVTVQANASFGNKLTTLLGNVGDERMPLGLDEKSMDGRWGFARAQRRVLVDALSQLVAARVDGAGLRQLFNFCYADTAKMQTLGWLVTSAALTQAASSCRFEQLDFIRDGEMPLELKVPVLTRRELQYLNQKFPPRRKLTQKWLDPELVRQYQEVYRYYPDYVAGGS